VLFVYILRFYPANSSYHLWSFQTNWYVVFWFPEAQGSNRFFYSQLWEEANSDGQAGFRRDCRGYQILPGVIGDQGVLPFFKQ